MSVLQELKEQRTTPRDLRKFGLIVGTVFVLLAFWGYFHHKPAWPFAAATGMLLLLFGAVSPMALRVPYLGWMAAGFSLGFIVSTIMLTLIYYLAITPIALLARAAGKDFLKTSSRSAAQTYWIRRASPRKPTRAEYERQF